LATYVNVPPIIGSVINSRLATLHELETVYSLEDLYNLYEILIIKTANEQKMIEKARERRGRK